MGPGSFHVHGWRALWLSLLYLHLPHSLEKVFLSMLIICVKSLHKCGFLRNTLQTGSCLLCFT